jgi:hypothetical protein
MIWFVIVAVAVLYISWQFKAPSQFNDYVSEDTRIHYALGRQARQRAFVDWARIEKDGKETP